MAGDRPVYTVKGTVSAPLTGTFVCGATVETRELIDFMDDHPRLVEARTNSMSGRPFSVVWARDLRDHGYRVSVNMAPDAGWIIGWP